MTWLPSCPIHDLTGFYCMTCGATRAVLSLTQGQILTAMRQNALIVLSMPPAAYQLAAFLVNGAIRRPLLPSIQITWKAGRLLLAIALLFMLVRNLPIHFARYLVP